ncbi:C2 domain-containing protein [Mytilinidion resinicola]|uniref:C2 domain-containing protein n=1 Tax=Mytilinidion resinicola TaxID=574789 RepID=A0A6A6YN23_9PEZI|nr:C2 domain-containing protein [Mytilinidion resinicola]KAF2810141.1 C2 domain-containing protein [Mytilinidion resinicola]
MDDRKVKQPAGGYDDTKIPHAPPGYTVKITFHRATNLPMADINSLSSDPFVLAQINTSLESRHKEDPHLRMRSKTVRKCTDPVWECEWIVANIPASGFKLKARIYDEDPADHDDRLGNVHVLVGQINEQWAGIKEQSYPIKKRMGSKRAYFVRAIAACFNKNTHMTGHLYVSVQVLGRTEGDEGGRAYTLGPCWWTKHYSPLLGRITGKKDVGDEESEKAKSKNKAQQYNFQANQFQLRGPVPADLYHRYVEFKPFVKSMFTGKGIRGFLLFKALHHQHARVYNFDRSTEYDIFQQPCKEMTLKFLDLVHWDEGGRIFTYVLTLDSLFRFTETGKEFGIDMLSKHTMHSDVSIYIAFSGEFFIRRLKYPDRDPPEEGGDNPSSPPDEISGGPSEGTLHKDPTYFELVIDNDSGTYRPNAKLLPQLKSFFEAQFPGLHISTLDSQGDAEKMAAMKQEQRDRKKKEGDHIVYKQLSRNSSMSSSDEEELDRLAAQGEPEDGTVIQNVKKEIKYKQDRKKDRLKTYKPGFSRDGVKGAGQAIGEKVEGSSSGDVESAPISGKENENIGGPEGAAVEGR